MSSSPKTKLSSKNININVRNLSIDKGRPDRTNTMKSLKVPVPHPRSDIYTDRFGSVGATSRRNRESELEEDDFDKLSHLSVRMKFVSCILAVIENELCHCRRGKSSWILQGLCRSCLRMDLLRKICSSEIKKNLKLKAYLTLSLISVMKNT